MEFAPFDVHTHSFLFGPFVFAAAWHGMALAPKGSKDFMFAPRALRNVLNIVFCFFQKH